MAQVVLLGEGLERLARTLRPLLQEVVEQTFPRGAVHARRVGNHAVHVEDHRVEAVGIDVNARHVALPVPRSPVPQSPPRRCLRHHKSTPPSVPVEVNTEGRRHARAAGAVFWWRLSAFG